MIGALAVGRIRVAQSTHEDDIPHCLAGHLGLELRNVDANYPFESSRGFPGSEPNSIHQRQALQPLVVHPPNISARPNAANANRHVPDRQANPPSAVLTLPPIEASRIARIAPQRSPRSSLNPTANSSHG